LFGYLVLNLHFYPLKTIRYPLFLPALGADAMRHLRRAAIFTDKKRLLFERVMRPTVAGLGVRMSFGVTHGWKIVSRE
jgi:hypothetical protein